MGKRNLLRLRVDPAQVRDGRIVLAAADVHHVRVRRLRSGDAVVCFDDSGAEYGGTLRRVEAHVAEVEIDSTRQPGRESPLRLTLAQAVLKGDHLDLVVEKATELGVVEIVLFECDRALARPSRGRLDRLQRIAESAAKQSGRLHLPAIRGPVSLAEVLVPPAILFEPRAGNPLSPDLGEFDVLRAIVGPEGGFADAEVAQARAAGCMVAGLGPRVLRAETAAVAVCSLLQFLWGDLG